MTGLLEWVVELVVVVPTDAVPVVFVDALCMPVFIDVAFVVIAPDAFNLVAVTLSIIVTSLTVAPDINISSIQILFQINYRNFDSLV